jgi:hypothetical protein
LQRNSHLASNLAYYGMRLMHLTKMLMTANKQLI